MKFTKSYCKICKRPGHTPQECKAKQNIRRFLSASIRRPQAHIVEDFRGRERRRRRTGNAALMEENEEYEEQSYNDFMEAFVVEALITNIPTKKDDKWYLNTGATNHLTNQSVFPNP